MLVGVPLGLSSKRGGKSTGFVLTILLVFLYYFLSLVGVAFAKSGKLSPFLGVWGANLLFTARRRILLHQMSRGGIALSIFSSIGHASQQALRAPRRRHTPTGDPAPNLRRPSTLVNIATILQPLPPRSSASSFPLLLDDYVMREYVTNFALVLVAFSLLFLIFTFFELIGDIIRNQHSPRHRRRLPLQPRPLHPLQRHSALLSRRRPHHLRRAQPHLRAHRHEGHRHQPLPHRRARSLRHAHLRPLFVFDEFYLPAANRRQEALLSVIKGKPAQTFLRPDRQWISGQTGSQPANPRRIFYYQFFDPDQDTVFANLTVFEFDPSTFTLTRRIFASYARWDPQRQRLGLRQRLAAHLQRRIHRHLPALHRRHLSRDPRAARLLQQRRPPVRSRCPTASSPATSPTSTIRLRHHAPPRPAQQQARLPAHHAGHGDPRHPLRALHGQKRWPRRHRHRHRRGHRLLGRRRRLRNHGQTSTPSPRSRRLVARPPLRHRRTYLLLRTPT